MAVYNTRGERGTADANIVDIKAPKLRDDDLYTYDKGGGG